MSFLHQFTTLSKELRGNADKITNRKKKQDQECAGWPDCLETSTNHGLAGSANPNFIFVIAPQGEMASFPIGTTPFLLEISSSWGNSMHEIPRAPDDAADQKAGQYLPIRLNNPCHKRVYIALVFPEFLRS
jgi:hypothetical protein